METLEFVIFFQRRWIAGRLWSRWLLLVAGATLSILSRESADSFSQLSCDVNCAEIFAVIGNTAARRRDFYSRENEREWERERRGYRVRFRAREKEREGDRQLGRHSWAVLLLEVIKYNFVSCGGIFSRLPQSPEDMAEGFRRRCAETVRRDEITRCAGLLIRENFGLIGEN